MAAKLKDLDLTSEELERFTKAFEDEKFREMFVQYSEEINDPENRRKYEEEIRQMENERGMDIRFIHPKPGHVLLTSVNGMQKCYLNICSNDLLQKPDCNPGVDGENRAGLQWSIPYSLSPGREDLGKDGQNHIIYDVVFHPDTLHIANRNEKFKKMVDSTALEAVASHFHIKLDTVNVKTLSVKYKGIPNPSVLRKPLSGATSKDGDPDDPLKFPYPYNVSREGTSVKKETSTDKVVSQVKNINYQVKEATVPLYSIKHRSYIDLQDYRESRDSTPSPVPKELEITVDLPLLNSAAGVNLHIKGKSLSLESEKPVYKLNVTLPYAVEDDKGKAQFNKAKRQLVVTLPVIQQNILNQMQNFLADTNEEERIERKTEPNMENANTHQNISSNECKRKEFIEKQFDASTWKSRKEEKQELRTLNEDLKVPPPAEDLPVKNCKEKTVHWVNEDEISLHNEAPMCPIFTCSQDTTTLTLVVHVSNIDEHSINKDIDLNHYHIRFNTNETNGSYILLLKFHSQDQLNPNTTSIHFSKNNVVIELTKSSESFGLWKNMFFGVNEQSLQERKFVIEENVNEFLSCPSAPATLSVQEKQSFIDVFEMNETKTHIRINKSKLECVSGELENKQSRDQSKSERGTNMEPRHGCLTHDSKHCESQESPIRETTENNREHTLETGEECEHNADAVEARCKKQQKESDFPFPGDTENYKVENKADNMKACLNTTEDDELDEDDTPNPLECSQKTVSDKPALNQILNEINSKDGEVQVISDHKTHCAYQFQNSLLYDLD